MTVQDIHELVSTLWTSKTSEGHVAVMWDQFLKRYSMHQIVGAIRKNRGEDLDSLRPSWEAIRNHLIKSGHGTTNKTRFQIYIESHRADPTWTAWQTNRSDAEVWQKILEVSTAAIKDPKLRQVQMQNHEDYWLREHYAADLKPPSFLLGD